VVEDVREALVRQWQVISQAIPAIDLEALSRVKGWRNRELLAHLAFQPKLLARFLETASTAPPQISLVANLSGTTTLSEAIDRAARRIATRDLIFAENVAKVIPALERADLAATVVTMQGPILLRDYLVTRCVEAVVHGWDFTPPVDPYPSAMRIACAALRDVIAELHPDVLAAVESLPPATWLNIATGREPPPPSLQACCPVMS
jgi:Mycothiol maleylpyruvate isomerase N-terminal domain